MAKLPFLRVAGPPLLHGLVTLRIRLSTEWAAPALASIDELVLAFLRVGGRGGLGPREKAGPSLLLLNMPGKVMERDLVYELWSSGVDRRSFQFLRHMVSRPELGEAVATRMDVSAAGELQWVDLAAVDDGNEAETYPAPSERYAFEVVWVEDVEPSTSRRVLVEFRDELDREDFARLEEPVSAWNYVLEAGAFALPFGLPDVAESAAGFLTTHDAFTVEIGVSAYRASEVGIDCLLRMLDAIAFAPSVISRVCIE